LIIIFNSWNIYHADPGLSRTYLLLFAREKTIKAEARGMASKLRFAESGTFKKSKKGAIPACF
jgi:hypothetical protein